MADLYTVVVVWDRINDNVRPFGPTSTDRQLLRATLDNAREEHLGAEVVRWSHRQLDARLVSRMGDIRRRSIIGELG